MVQKSSWVKNSSLCQASYPSKKSPKNLPRKCTTAVRFIAFHRICNFTKQNSSQNLFGKNYQVIIETSVVQKYFDSIQRTLTVEGSITEWLVSSLRLDLTASSVTTTTYFLFGQIETLNTHIIFCLMEFSLYAFQSEIKYTSVPCQAQNIHDNSRFVEMSQN